MFFKKFWLTEPSFEEELLAISIEVKRYLISKGASKEDAEDAVQDTFYKMLLLVDDLSPDTIRPWFYRVAMNNLIDVKRREKTGERLVKKIYSANEINLEGDKFQPSQEQLVQVLAKLKEEQGEILMLKYYYELSYSEISHILNYSEHKVRTLLYRARKAARLLLKEEEENDVR